MTWADPWARAALARFPTEIRFQMIENMKNTTKNNAMAPDTALRLASSMLDTGLRGLEAYVTATAETVAESRDVEAATDFAHLLTKVAVVAGELRKAEAAERKAASEISKADMVEAARRMDATERARFVRELQAIDSRKSGLA